MRGLVSSSGGGCQVANRDRACTVVAPGIFLPEPVRPEKSLKKSLSYAMHGARGLCNGLQLDLMLKNLKVLKRLTNWSP